MASLKIVFGPKVDKGDNGGAPDMSTDCPRVEGPGYSHDFNRLMDGGWAEFHGGPHSREGK